MADFDYAIKIILRHEGGLVDNPHDPGGITNWGITIPFLKTLKFAAETYFGHPSPVTRDDIRGMTREQAVTIYRAVIWDPNHYADLSDDKVGTKVFDTTVNMGEKRGEILAQQAANRCGANLFVDGQIGPKSIAVINALDPMAFLKEYCQLQRERYEWIVHERPESAVFLKGWLARALWPLNGE